MFEKALYYPHIDIYDDRWLKSAALFWDRIETIVPESMVSPYKRRLTNALEGEGILVAHRVNPFCEDVQGIEQDVVRYLNTTEGKRAFSRPLQTSVSRNIIDNEFWSDEFRRKLKEKYQDFFIHVDKLPLILRDQLAGHQNEDGFVWAREGFMSFYMTLLANRICRNNDMALLTARVGCNNLSSRILKDRMSCDNNIDRPSKRALVYQIAMDDIKIDPSTPIDTIIRFRMKRKQELARFRVEMDRLTSFWSEGMSVEDVENELKWIYDNQILPAVSDVKASLKDANIVWLSSPVACIFSGLIPTLLTSDLSTTAGALSCISQGIGLGVSSIPVVENFKVKRNPYMYLVRMKQEFSSAGKK